MLTSREPPSGLTTLVSLLEWGGDSTPAHVVTIATVGWIVIALMCAMLWVISLLNEDWTAP